MCSQPPCPPAGLTGLTRLRLARRPYLTDAQLAPLLAANRGSLRQLELAGCASLTDAVLLSLLPLAQRGSGQRGAQAGEEEQAGELGPGGQSQQQGSGSDVQQQQQQAVGSHSDGCPAALAAPPQPPSQRQQAPPLERLHMVCCDRITGSSLRHLRRLRSLRLSGCPAVSEAALQVGWLCYVCGQKAPKNCGCLRFARHTPCFHPHACVSPHSVLQAAAICCTRLTLLELPPHIPASCMPVAPAGAASHLHGLQLLGGVQEGGRWGTRGRR